MRLLAFPAVLVASAAIASACATGDTGDMDSGVDEDSGVKPETGTACPIASQKRCGTNCVDTTKDLANCGNCGVKCAANMYCAASKCNSACTSPLKLCGQFCVDLTSDHDNCGKCGMGCASDQDCINSACIKHCPLGLTVCDPDCVDLTSDYNHCGDCSTQCGMNETCVGGQCCGIGQTACNGVCTNTQYDNNNCGSCGYACGGPTPYCANGICKTCNPTALLLMDNNAGDQTFVNAVTAAGIQNTYVKGGVNSYSGNPSPNGFGAIVMMSGSSFTDMNMAGQTAILNANNNANVGIVIDEWALYLKSLGYWNTLSNAFIVNYTTFGTSSTHTIQTVQGHPILNGLANSWNLTFSTYGVYGSATVNNGVQIAKCSTCTGTSGVFVRDNSGNVGRRVQITLPFTYSSTTWSNDANVVKLMINSIRWATGCN
jgi:hypothetical protein